MPSPTDDETPFPALSHAAGLNLNALDRSHLSPHDAFTYPLRQPYDGDGPADPLSHLRHLKDDRSRSRRRKRAWKKLMWVKQSCKFISVCLSSWHRLCFSGRLGLTGRFLSSPFL
jgi:phosphatidylinositol glycan class C protein